jgi:6-phosphogluconolactonase
MGLKFQWIRRAVDSHAVARTAADEVLQLSHEAISERGVFRVALSGGSTPRTMYELLSGSTMARFDRWHFYWGDERYVPPDHPDSNFLMAQQTLLGRIPLSHHQIHRIRTEVGNPSKVASDYEDELRYSFDISKDEIPRFDLILLGLGEDGHTASLFPGSPLLDRSDSLVAATWVEALQGHRITLTLPVINEARAVIFTVCGSSKADALKDVLEERGDPRERPARLVSPRDGTVLWIIDEDASRALDGPLAEKPPAAS